MKISLKLVIFGILFICMTSIGIQQTFAQVSDSQPDNYKIMIEIVDVGEIDLGTGSFEMVFWIYLSSDEINFNDTPPPKIDYVNAKEFTIITNRTTAHEYNAKISGTFFLDELTFRSYPYMNIKLIVIIETVDEKIDKVEFLIDKPIKTEVLIPGWNYLDTTFNVIPYSYNEREIREEVEAESNGKTFKNKKEKLDWIEDEITKRLAERLEHDGETYSRFIFTYQTEKPFLSSFVVGILPIMIMGIIAIVTFVLDPVRQEFKAGVIGGILMAAVFFQVASVDKIPSLEYLTLQDKIITTFYVILIVMMTELLAQWKYNSANNQEKAQKINKKFRIILLTIAIGVFIILNADMIYETLNCWLVEICNHTFY